MEKVSPTRKQLRVIELLAQGATRREAAVGAGVGERTVYRWLRDPSFQAALEDAQRELWSSTVSGLKSGIRRALDFVLKTLDAPQASTREKLAAARALLQTALRVIEVAELVQLQKRLEVLEQTILEQTSKHDAGS